MSVWLIVLLCIAGFFLADAVLRQFMPNLLHFATIPGTGDSKHLIVFLPGILADGDVSSREVRESWLAKAGTLLTVDYGHQRFDSRRVVGNVARQISFSHGAGGSYGRVTIIGASMGGKLGAKLIGQLRNVYQWQPEDLTLIAVDTPTSPDDFAGPGKILSWILSKIYAGPLLSWLLMWPLRLALVLPKDREHRAGAGCGFRRHLRPRQAAGQGTHERLLVLGQLRSAALLAARAVRLAGTPRRSGHLPGLHQGQ